MALLNFRKFFEVFGPLLETFQGKLAMFLSRFLAPNTLYQMRPKRGQMDLYLASYGTFKIFEIFFLKNFFQKLKMAITRRRN